MMRSIHVVPSINDEASGPSYSVARLCAELYKTGNPTTLVTLNPTPNHLGSLVRGFPRSFGPARLAPSSKLRRWLWTEAHNRQCDVMHNHSLWMLPNLYPSWAVSGTECKLVVSPRGTLSPVAMTRSKLIKSLSWPVLVAPVLRSAAAFHATSEAEFLDIRARKLLQPVAVLPNGIDIPSDTTARNTLSERRQILFLGRIHPIKGVENLVRAWSSLESEFPDWDLSIVGPSEDGHLAHLQALTQRLGIRRVTFAGPLFGQQKLEAYRRADLYVLPTHTENFGMTVAEALAAGTPVITTKGAPWAGLQRERAGWWIDTGVEPLTVALQDALSTPSDTLTSLGAHGREWMERDFSWNRIATDMMRFYHWLRFGGEAPEFVRTD